MSLDLAIEASRAIKAFEFEVKAHKVYLLCEGWHISGYTPKLEDRVCLTGKGGHKELTECECERALDVIRAFHFRMRPIMDDVNEVEVKEPEPVLISGVGAEITADEFRAIFNEHVRSIADMSDSDLIQHQIKLDRLVAEAKIQRMAAFATYKNRYDNASSEEREKLRQLDRLYKPKPPSIETIEKTKKAVKAAAPGVHMSRAEKALQALVNSGMDMDKIAELLLAKRK